MALASLSTIHLNPPRAEPLTVEDVRELAIAIPQMKSLVMVELKGRSRWMIMCNSADFLG